MKCFFENDNNVKIKLIDNPKSIIFEKRYNHEEKFRIINTYLINNNIISKDRNIIDLGSWIGDNSIPWAMNINGIVYAIDPCYENINFIKELSNINNINNIKCIQSAISNKNETLRTNGNLEHCSFVWNNPKNTGKNIVSAVSLDYLYTNKEIENIGYIHLDVEGMEYKILEGSIEIIKNENPIITFEQHLTKEDYNIIVNFLTVRNYHVYLIEERLLGCRRDCRNFIAFPENIFNQNIIDNINNLFKIKILSNKK
jgi:FkbM family methyltransferase